MDLRVAVRVLWRFRVLVAATLVLAVALSALSYVRVHVSAGGISVAYRKPELWQSQATLLLTQTGFPYGNAVQGYEQPNVEGAPAVIVGDTARLTQLATIYAELVNSDFIRREVFRGGRRDGINIHAAVGSTASGVPPTVPVMSITAVGLTPRAAALLARRATAAFQRYLAASQDAAQIPHAQRVLVMVTSRAATNATLLQARKKTMPLFVFLAVLTLGIGLCFGLENLRPQVHRLAVEKARLIPGAMHGDP